MGARPQFIKSAPVSKAIKKAGIEEIIIHTGQHYDPGMSDIFFRQMDIPEPNYFLDINQLSHAEMTGRMNGKPATSSADFSSLFWACAPRRSPDSIVRSPSPKGRLTLEGYNSEIFPSRFDQQRSTGQ